MTVATETFSVLIAESEELVRLGQQDMVTGTQPFKVAGTAGDVSTLLVVVRESKPDIIIVSDRMCEDSDPSALVQALRELSPSSSVILTLSGLKAFWPAVDACADGYCDRDAQLAHLRQALHAVSRHERYISPNLTEYLLKGDGLPFLQAVAPKICSHAATELESLSKREKDVMKLLADGMSNENIAKELGLSIQTVKVHVKHILKKLNVADRTQAVIKAIKNGIG